MLGKFARDNQLITAAAGTGDKADLFLREALSCTNPKFLNHTAMERDRTTGELRT